MKLVKFDCGCIGFEPLENENKTAVLVKVCDGRDGDGPKYLMTRRSMSPNEWHPLGDVETNEIRAGMLHLLMDGDKFRKIKKLLA